MLARPCIHASRPSLALLAAKHSSRTRGLVSNPRTNRTEMERAWLGGIDEPFPLDPLHTKATINKLALLFPGTGSQYVGMGAFLLKAFPSARKIWDEAEHALATFDSWRRDLCLESEPDMAHFQLDKWSTWQNEPEPGYIRKIVFGGPQDELMRSSIAQPAIFISSIVFLRSLELELGVPLTALASFYGGHSAGEYTAVHAAGSISFADAVRLTRLHGLLTSRTMQLSSLRPHMDWSAPPEHRAQMSAVIINPGHTHQQVEDIVQSVKRDERDHGNKEFSVEVASFNSTAQLVLSGSRTGVLHACQLLQQNGIAARAADLPVAAPFHCSFMNPAALGMQIALDRAQTVQPPHKPIVSGLNARLITTPAEIKSHLTKQISHPVRWSAALDTLRANGVSHMVFCGPGKALGNLAKREVERGYWSHSPNNNNNNNNNNNTDHLQSSSTAASDPNIDITTLATEQDFAAAVEKFYPITQVTEG